MSKSGRGHPGAWTQQLVSFATMFSFVMLASWLQTSDQKEAALQAQADATARPEAEAIAAILAQSSAEPSKVPLADIIARVESTVGPGEAAGSAGVSVLDPELAALSQEASLLATQAASVASSSPLGAAALGTVPPAVVQPAPTPAPAPAPAPAPLPTPAPAPVEVDAHSGGS